MYHRIIGCYLHKCNFSNYKLTQKKESFKYFNHKFYVQDFIMEIHNLNYTAMIGNSWI